MMRQSGAPLLIVLLAACTDYPPPPAPPTADAHRRSVDEWSADRFASLSEPVNWLSLSGLFWLEPGRNTFGSDSSNSFVYDPTGRAIPPRIGAFNLADSVVTFEAQPGVVVTAGGQAVATVDMSTSDSLPLVTGALVWRRIARNGRAAIRMWDTLSTVRTEFNGIDRFPVDLRWRFPARFIVHDPPDTIDVPNILGTINRTASPASVEFEYAGEAYRLMTWKDSDDPANFFTAFADRTNGATTYGGGRFIWIDAPDPDGWTVVDFNRSYNPPCVFSDWATCPLPPRSNRLPFAIEAGERSYEY